MSLETKKVFAHKIEVCKTVYQHFLFINLLKRLYIKLSKLKKQLLRGRSETTFAQRGEERSIRGNIVQTI